MEGTKLIKLREKMRPYGFLQVYENDYYTVRVLYAGDLPESGKEGGYQYNPRLLRITADVKDHSIPELMVLPGDGERESYAGIDEHLPVSFDQIENYRTNLLIGKETLEEIDRVVKETYPNINIIEK